MYVYQTNTIPFYLQLHYITPMLLFALCKGNCVYLSDIYAYMDIPFKVRYIYL